MSQLDLFHSHLRQRMDAQFVAAYPTTENGELAKTYGVHIRTICQWAQQLGLRKDREWLRQQISAKAMGRVISEETKAKILKTKRERGTLGKGESHYRWKGGKTWERFKDPEYIAWRNAVLERDGYICQDCSRQCKKYEKGLAAHHIQPYATHPELRLELSNGVTLCRKCHMIRHARPLVPKDQIPCACGCGTMIAPVDPYGRPRAYAHYHGTPHGAANRLSKLTENDVRAIRADPRKQHEIAADFGISRATVSLIKSRKHWRQVI